MTTASVFRPFRHGVTGHSDRAAGDRQRHRQKVRASIKDNIGDIIADESIIGRSGDKTVKVPIRGIREYRFVYGDNKQGAAEGTGDGKAQRGAVVGDAKDSKEGKGDRAGNKPGEDYYETEITIDELIDIMFEDLKLPDMDRKQLRFIDSMSLRKRKGYRRVGIRVRLDRRKTARNRRRRGQPKGVFRFPAVVSETELMTFPENIRMYYIQEADGCYRRNFPFNERDEVYRHMDEKVHKESNAVVFCIMDTSGSMDTLKKYLARSFFFLLYQFVRTKYQRVEIVFIAHHTEAREVTEEEFFSKGESGGTYISSAYKKTLGIIEERYDPELWNIYAFHCSDGDNFDSDNKEAVESLLKLARVCNLLGYGEIKPLGSRYYEHSMLNHYRAITAPNFRTVLIEKKEDVWSTFKELLNQEVVRS
jgi:hypothetical protein